MFSVGVSPFSQIFQVLNGQFRIIRSTTLKDITVIPFSCGKKTDAVFVVVLVAPARISIWPFGHLACICPCVLPCFASVQGSNVAQVLRMVSPCCRGVSTASTASTAASSCLPDAVPDNERSYIKDVTGEDVEIKLVAYDWPSAEFVTSISQILIQEVLGYKAKIHTTRPFSVLEAILSLTGCNDMTCDRTADVAGYVAHVAHVVLESWLGSMGYAGEEAMFVSPWVVKPMKILGILWTGTEATTLPGGQHHPSKGRGLKTTKFHRLLYGTC